MFNYQKAEVEADDDTGANGDGGELKIAEMVGEGLGDHKHGVGGYAAENGGADYVP